jgi:hypothetical protein
MAKYFGVPLLLMAFFMVGCGPKVATEKQATEGMDNVGSMGDQLGAEKGAQK